MEVWKDIPDLGSLYQLSDKGRVRSLDRLINIANRKGKSYTHKGKVLKPHLVGGRPHYILRVNKKSKGFCVHTQVLKVFGTYDKELKVRHIDGNRENCALNNLEQYSEKTDSCLELPHICNRGCGTTAKNVKQATELFPSQEIDGKVYYRGNCTECRNNEEKLRMRERTKKKRYVKACANPVRYNCCYDCGNVQLNTKKACTECNSTELSQFEEC